MKRIAVITRTKNRALLLNRCLNSLIKQTYKDFIWVVVNDNGNSEDVEKIANKAKDLGITVQVFHRTCSSGVAAAANTGISNSISEFIHILDDDDSIESNFYEETITFLDIKSHYSAVITGVKRINEEIRGDQIISIDSHTINCPDSTLFIADLLWKNQFTTNSFVFRRATLKTVGMYDEDLPVLEDWDFNLRFIKHYDIGVISKVLANYHWRVGTVVGGTAQTITTGISLHNEYTAIIRNKLLRQDISSGQFGLGTLMTLGRYHQLEHNALYLMNDKLNALLAFRQFIKRMLNFSIFKNTRK